MLVTFIIAMRENANKSLVATFPTTLNLPGLESYLIIPNVVGVKKAPSLSIGILFSFSEILLQQEVATASAEIHSTVIIFWSLI